ncbi:MAG: signal peptidase I [Flavobacteriales bacterium]|jgi:signal peptidase I
MTIPVILLILIYIIYSVSLGKIFEKAGREKSAEGYIPIYNLVIWLKVLKKPVWWLVFFFIPFVNLIIMVACHVETARLFGKYAVKETLLTIFVPWYMIPTLAFKDEHVIEAPTDWDKKADRERRSFHDHITLFCMAPFIGHALLLVFKLTGSGKRKEGKGTMEYEWTNAIGFAVVAATIIRTFFFEAFTIPTGSMEKTMRIGDYLFVNKIKYGARIPMHPVSFPFVHNRLPGTHIKSYTNWFETGYYRLPGYGTMQAGDPMVFNWPVGDSVLLHNDIIAHDYYAIVRNEAILPYVQQGKVSSAKQFQQIADKAIAIKRNELINGGPLRSQYVRGSVIDKTGGIQTLAIDKKENYIKRCVAMHGQAIQIINGMISLDGVEQPLPEHSQFSYNIFFKPGARPFGAPYMDENYGTYTTINSDYNPSQNMIGGINNSGDTVGIYYAQLTTTQDVIENIKNHKSVDSVVADIHPSDYNYVMQGQYCPIFPNHPDFEWSRDNFGPLMIPEKDWKVTLTPENQIIYRRAIEVYEGNDVELKADGMYINGSLAADYTFKQNYYWMMGDNRHGSVDSRYWGFVPEDHIVGTASFIWMSKHPEKGWFSGGLRFDRVFSFVQ